MSAIKGRRPRPPATAVGTVSLQTRVSPKAKDVAERTAAVLGISLAAYIEELLLRAHTETPDGHPAWVVERMLTERIEEAQLELRDSA